MVKVGRDFTQNIRRKYDGEMLEGVQTSIAYVFGRREGFFDC